MLGDLAKALDFKCQVVDKVADLLKDLTVCTYDNYPILGYKVAFLTFSRKGNHKHCLQNPASERRCTFLQANVFILFSQVPTSISIMTQIETDFSHLETKPTRRLTWWRSNLCSRTREQRTQKQQQPRYVRLLSPYNSLPCPHRPNWSSRMTRLALRQVTTATMALQTWPSIKLQVQVTHLSKNVCKLFLHQPLFKIQGLFRKRRRSSSLPQRSLSTETTDEQRWSGQQQKMCTCSIKNKHPLSCSTSSKQWVKTRVPQRSPSRGTAKRERLL